jgi:hypothetical protein
MLSEQFSQLQLFDPGPERKPSQVDKFLNLNEDIAGDDPGPVGPRFPAGQGVMNFGKPDAPLYWNSARQVKRGLPATIPIDTYNDPDWDERAWDYGGAHRVDSGSTWAGDHDVAVTDRWADADIETFGPETQLRSGQQFLRSNETVQNLRRVDPDDWQELPWIATIGTDDPKSYVLDGHHRLTAARTSRNGEFMAHQIRAESWSAFSDQFDDYRIDDDEDYDSE